MDKDLPWKWHQISSCKIICKNLLKLCQSAWYRATNSTKKGKRVLSKLAGLRFSNPVLLPSSKVGQANCTRKHQNQAWANSLVSASPIQSFCHRRGSMDWPVHASSAMAWASSKVGQANCTRKDQNQAWANSLVSASPIQPFCHRRGSVDGLHNPVHASSAMARASSKVGQANCTGTESNISFAKEGVSQEGKQQLHNADQDSRSQVNTLLQDLEDHFINPTHDNHEKAGKRWKKVEK